jgi:glycosyltransferase 2 family protein
MSQWTSSVATMLRPIAVALAAAKPGYVLLAIGLYALSVPVAAFRWRAVLRGLQKDAPLGRLMLTNLAAICVNNVTPTSRLGGEACRVLVLVRGRVAATSIAVLSIVYERISEIPSVACLVVVALVVAGRGLPRATPIAVAAAVLVACVLAAVVIRAVPLIRSRLRLLTTKAMAPPVFAVAAAVSAAVWILDVMRLRAAAAAVGTSVSLGQAVTLSAITVAAGLVPSIGGLGVIEGGLVGGLVAFGVRPAEAAAITAIERAISYGLAGLAGAGALSVLGGRALWDTARMRVDEVVP